MIRMLSNRESLKKGVKVPKPRKQRDTFESPDALRIYLETRGFQVQDPNQKKIVLYMWLSNKKSGIKTDGSYFYTDSHPFVVIEPEGDAITSIYTRSTHPQTPIRKAPEHLSSRLRDHKCGSKTCRIDMDAWVCYNWPIPSYPPEMSNKNKNWFDGVISTSKKLCLESSPKIKAEVQLCASAYRI